MPAKQTRESIEAELNAGEHGRLARKLLSKAIQDFRELEKDLRQLEDEAVLPAFYRSKPLTERMAAVGMSQAVIDRVETYIDALDAVQSGRLGRIAGLSEKRTCRSGRRRTVRRRTIGGHR